MLLLAVGGSLAAGIAAGVEELGRWRTAPLGTVVLVSIIVAYGPAMHAVFVDRGRRRAVVIGGSAAGVLAWLAWWTVPVFLPAIYGTDPWQSLVLTTSLGVALLALLESHRRRALQHRIPRWSDPVLEGYRTDYDALIVCSVLAMAGVVPSLLAHAGLVPVTLVGDFGSTAALAAAMVPLAALAAMWRPWLRIIDDRSLSPAQQAAVFGVTACMLLPVVVEQRLSDEQLLAVSLMVGVGFYAVISRLRARAVRARVDALMECGSGSDIRASYPELLR